MDNLFSKATTMKTNARHTPGPWELRGGDIEARGVRLAVVDRPVDDAGNENAGLDWDEALGNATLIRSLPELIDERDALRAENAALVEALRDYYVAVEALPSWPVEFLQTHCDATGKPLPVAPWVKARALLRELGE